MINDNLTFYSYIGEVIMFCQKVEHDVKLLSAGVSPHGYKVAKAILDDDKLSLGQAIKTLQDFDALRDHPYFSREDYNALWEVNKIRNYYAHQCFQDLLYLPNEEERKGKLREVADKLEQHHLMLKSLSDKIEKERIKFFKSEIKL